MSTNVETIKIAVIGLGNELMSDDGIGIHVIRRLRCVLPAEVPCEEIGTAALQAQTLCEQAETIIAIDAVSAGGEPGDLYVFDLEDAPIPAIGSVHSLSLTQLIALIARDQRPRVVVVGVEPRRIQCGLDLSKKVRAVVPEVVRLVCSLVASGGLIDDAIRKEKIE